MWNRGNTVEGKFSVPPPRLPNFMAIRLFDVKDSTMKFGVYKKRVAIVVLHEQGVTAKIIF